MFFGMFAVALQVASLFVAMMFLRRERAHGWTYGHPIVFEFQNLLSTAVLLLIGSLIAAIIGLILDVRRTLSLIALGVFFAVLAVMGVVE